MKRILLLAFMMFQGMVIHGYNVGEFNYDHLEVYGLKELLSYDDTQGGTYKWAYESRCTSRDSFSPADRYGACLVMISNCTKGRLTADGSTGKKAIMISNDISPRSSATGAVYWSAVFRGGSGKEGKPMTFLYAHYLKMDDPEIQGTGRPVYFTIRCWNQRTIKFDPHGNSGLETSKKIIEIISEVGAFAPVVGHFIHAFGLMLKYGLENPPPPPDPNDYVYRLNAYMVTANPKVADCCPQWEVLYNKQGKPAYDSYAMHCAGQKEEDASSNYVVQNSCIRTVDMQNGCYSVPIYVINIYYSKDYYSAKLNTYCRYIKDLGWDKDNEAISALADKLSNAGMNNLIARFAGMKNDDLMKVNDAVESIFRYHNQDASLNQSDIITKCKEANSLLGDI